MLAMAHSIYMALAIALRHPKYQGWLDVVMSEECLLYSGFVVCGCGRSIGGRIFDRIQGKLHGGVWMLEGNHKVSHDGRRNIAIAALSTKYGREWAEGRRASSRGKKGK